MKKIFVLLTCFIPMLVLADTVPAGYCQVEVCNRIERFSLDPFSHLKDHLAETCMVTLVGKDDAVVGKKLSSESRWYQGSTINPTKESVTRVKRIILCGE